jgi:hypothetical protein
MDALKNLLIEIGKHPEMRAHATLVAAAKKELAEIEETNKYTVCGYCGHPTLKSDGAGAILDHIMNCEKRPERTLLDKAFEVEDRLYGFLNHVTGKSTDGEVNYDPTRCETCAEIKELLEIYNTKEAE